jgi:LPS sulfotransferase NodH
MMQPQQDLKLAALNATSHFSDQDVENILSQPVIILSAPRSGSTLLFEQLAQYEHFWTIGGESHIIFRAFASLRAENAQLDSMALGEEHADPKTCALFRRCFLFLLRNKHGVPFLSLPPHQRPVSVHLLEKTPRNALNIPFLLKVFPNAQFIYQHRDPRQTVSSLMEAWTVGLQTGRFVTFRDLPDWPLPAWCFLLPRNWRDMRGKSLAEIAAFQWCASNLAIIEGLSILPDKRWTCVDYTALVNDPRTALAHMQDALGLTRSAPDTHSGILPLSRTTVSPPHPDKWKRHENEIKNVEARLSDVRMQISEFCKHH